MLDTQHGEEIMDNDDDVDEEIVDEEDIDQSAIPQENQKMIWSTLKTMGLQKAKMLISPPTTRLISI